MKRGGYAAIKLQIVEIASLRNCHLGPPPGTRLKLVQPLGGAGA